VPDEDGWPAFLGERSGLRARPPWLFDADSGRRQLLKFFRLHDLTGFGIEDRPLAIAAAGALLGYVEETQKQQLPHLTSIAVETGDGAIAMNAATRRHLERDTRVDGDTRNTLLGVRDSTVTPRGGRLLRRWLHRPLRDRQVLGERHHAVQTLADSGAEADIRELFRGLGDMEPLRSRFARPPARSRYLSSVRRGVSMLPQVRSAPEPLKSQRLQALAEGVREPAAERHLMVTALVEQPPVLARAGGVI